MKQKISCPCGSAFSVEAPEEIDLDRESEYIDKITDGSFMSFHCPGCGKKHKPEFPVTLLWPGRSIRFEVLPELERGEFYRRKKDPPGPGDSALRTETIIGYPELSDRVAVIRDGLEPAVIEALKYYLLLKAEETWPGLETSVWYQGKGPESIEFHLHGIRADEVAVSRVPLGVYGKTLEDYKKHPGSEVFASLRIRSYISVQNMMRPEKLK
ncbi:MAG: CpXC domain-containing protein [Treponema sp.]|nr:CpXC domain-containing protein [Treponema sp.]